VWDAPSLCEAWKVRDVVAHMTTAARYGPDEFLTELQADGGDVGQTIDRIAARDGRLDTDALLADLRDERLHRWTPPGGGEQGALIHAVIHGLDITVPLDLDVGLPDDTTRPVLEALTTGGVSTNFGVNLDGIALRATDLDWVWGDGRQVISSATDLALALCGRRPSGRWAPASSLAELAQPEPSKPR
jgi:uncharacterized protein (TIGR03083 family)